MTSRRAENAWRLLVMPIGVTAKLNATYVGG